MAFHVQQVNARCGPVVEIYLKGIALWQNFCAVDFLTRHGEQFYLQLLQANPFHPSLRLHALSGGLKGLHSVSSNLSYRITLELLIQDGQVIPLNVGDHDAVY